MIAAHDQDELGVVSTMRRAKDGATDQGRVWCLVDQGINFTCMINIIF
jgi:hypothetical protein